MVIGESGELTVLRKEIHSNTYQLLQSGSYLIQKIANSYVQYIVHITIQLPYSVGPVAIISKVIVVVVTIVVSARGTDPEPCKKRPFVKQENFAKMWNFVLVLVNKKVCKNKPSELK